jgi:aerobic C4-dicarboxylate transport protein
MIGAYGVRSLEQLASLVAVFWLAVALFALVVLGAMLRVASGLSVLRFLAYFREELTVVLATASSDAVLPQVMRKLERMEGRRIRRRSRGSHRLLVWSRRVMTLP